MSVLNTLWASFKRLTYDSRVIPYLLQYGNDELKAQIAEVNLEALDLENELHILIALDLENPEVFDYVDINQNIFGKSFFCCVMWIWEEKAEELIHYEELENLFGPNPSANYVLHLYVMFNDLEDKCTLIEEQILQHSKERFLELFIIFLKHVRPNPEKMIKFFLQHSYYLPDDTIHPTSLADLYPEDTIELLIQLCHPDHTYHNFLPNVYIFDQIFEGVNNSRTTAVRHLTAPSS